MSIMLTALVVPPARAQDGPSPLAAARFRLGVFGVTPTLALDSLGIDNNVFNDEVNPKRDVTATLDPGLSTWMKAGPGVFTTRSSAAVRYYKQYANQRSISAATEFRLDMPLRWFKPYISESRGLVRDRPSLEIDARVRSQGTVTTIGTRLALGPRTIFDVSTRRAVTVFDDAATYQGVSLPEQLNQESKDLTATAGYRLTPVTTATVTVLTQQNAFKSASGRDSGTLAVMPGLEFGHSGPLSGRASVGYRRFNINDDRVENFAGLVASADLVYVVRGSTQLGVKVLRDVYYSFSLTEPYYLLTGVTGTIRQQISQRMEVLGGFDRQFLSYRRLLAPPVPGATETLPEGRIVQFTAGVGFRVSSTTRFTVTAESISRPAGFLHQYDNFRILSSVSYAP